MRISWQFVAAGFGLLLLLAAAFMAAFPMSPPPAPASAIAAPVGILIVRRRISAGEQLSDNDLEWRMIGKGDTPSGAIVRGKGGQVGAIGAIVRHPLVSGQALREDDIDTATQGSSLEHMLNPGMRAITIPLDNVQAASGLLHPDDRIDILCLAGGDGLTRPETSGDAGGPVLLSNVRILAINGQTSEIDLAKLAVSGSMPGGHGASGSTITVELPVAQAARLALKASSAPVAIMLRRHFEPDSSSPAFPSAAANTSVLRHGLNRVRPLASPASAAAHPPVEDGSVLVIRGQN